VSTLAEGRTLVGFRRDGFVPAAAVAITMESTDNDDNKGSGQQLEKGGCGTAGEVRVYDTELHLYHDHTSTCQATGTQAHFVTESIPKANFTYGWRCSRDRAS